MGFTIEQLGILEAAIAQGALEVNYGDKKVVYRSLTEMQRTREMMKDELGLNGKTNRNRRYGVHTKGLR